MCNEVEVEVTKIGTWNVRFLYEAARCHCEGNGNYGLKVLGLYETRWIQAGIILYSGYSEANAHHTEGVGIMLSMEAQKELLSWEPISSRIITA